MGESLWDDNFTEFHRWIRQGPPKDHPMYPDFASDVKGQEEGQWIYGINTL
jgi:hypothetical protein